MPFTARVKPVRDCTNCENGEYIGGGDTACMAYPHPLIVMEDFSPTDVFMFCGGDLWEER